MTTANRSEFQRRQLLAKIDSALLYATFSLLLFGPLAFGAVEQWSIFVVECGSAILLFGWVIRQAMGGTATARWNPVFAPMGAFGVLVLIQLTVRSSAYAHDTLSLGLLYIAYGVLCFLASHLLLQASQVRALALIFSCYGAAVASFALIQGISSNGKLYWMREPRNGGWVYGPYVNHNHYAGLMEMLVPIPLIVALSQTAPRNLRAAAAASAAVMVGTIFLSGSRGGMLAITIELTMLAIVLVKRKRGVRTAVSIGAFLAIVIGLTIWIGGGELERRMATIAPGHTELSGDIRSFINRDGLRMFMQRPVLGWGLGTFPIVYPRFRGFYTNFFVNEAHNDYLQLLVEMGTAGFATMVWFLITVYVRGLKKMSCWETEVSGALALSCVLGLSGILVHSAVDFNLQIPANAALFYVLCTIAAADALVQPARKRRRARPEHSENNFETDYHRVEA